jgi:DNA-binding transcriptional ArsR family regulator
MHSLATYLLGSTRTAILAALLMHPDDARHVRELARITGVSPGTLHRELMTLTSMGILLRDKVGRQVFYRANRECPIFPELAGLIRKTAGLVDVLREALRPLLRRVEAAFVYGSIPAGEAHSRSDVDLMVVGKVTLGEVVKALTRTQAVLQRDVNPTVSSRETFRANRKSKDAFIASIWTGPKLWVIGSERELE